MQPSCIVGNVVHQCIHEFMHYNAQCHKRGKMVRVSCIKYEPPDIVLLSLYIDAFKLPDKKFLDLSEVSESHDDSEIP